MQNPSHATRECLVNHLMLLDARLAPKGLRDDVRAQMVGVTGRVPGCHFGASGSLALTRRSTSPASMAIVIDLLNFAVLSLALFAGAYFGLTGTGPD
jgi:hypothetical protein